jgi:glycosyltransferase involved in cell wall biosynthesis
VPPSDHLALRAAIESLLANPEQVTTLGHNAQKKVSQRFTSRHFAEYLAQVFKSL